MPKFKLDELFVESPTKSRTGSKKKKKKKKAEEDGQDTTTTTTTTTTVLTPITSPTKTEECSLTRLTGTYERYRQGLREDVLMPAAKTPKKREKKHDAATQQTMTPLRLPALGSSAVGLPPICIDEKAAPSPSSSQHCTREEYDSVMDVYCKICKKTSRNKGVSGHELLFSLRNNGRKKEARQFIDKCNPEDRYGWEAIMTDVLRIDDSDVPKVMRDWGFPKGWSPSFNPVHWCTTQSERVVRDVLMLWCLMTEKRCKGKPCAFFENVPLDTVEARISAVSEAQKGRPAVDFPTFRTFGEDFWPDCKDCFYDLFTTLDSTSQGFLTPGSLLPLIISSGNPLTTITDNLPADGVVENKYLATACTYTNRYLHFSNKWMWDKATPPLHLSLIHQ